MGIKHNKQIYMQSAYALPDESQRANMLKPFMRMGDSLQNLLRSGIVRFAPFNVLVFIWAACLIWGNHVPSRETEALRMPVSFASGACWGALFALAARLAIERRAWRTALARVLPTIAGATTAAVGTLFWYHVSETDVGYSFGEMIYFGSIVSIASFAVAQLFGKRNAWTARYGHADCRYRDTIQCLRAHRAAHGGNGYARHRHLRACACRP